MRCQSHIKILLTPASDKDKTPVLICTLEKGVVTQGNFETEYKTFSRPHPKNTSGNFMFLTLLAYIFYKLHSLSKCFEICDRYSKAKQYVNYKRMFISTGIIYKIAQFAPSLENRQQSLCLKCENADEYVFLPSSAFPTFINFKQAIF